MSAREARSPPTCSRFCRPVRPPLAAPKPAAHAACHPSLLVSNEGFPDATLTILARHLLPSPPTDLPTETQSPHDTMPERDLPPLAPKSPLRRVLLMACVTILVVIMVPALTLFSIYGIHSHHKNRRPAPNLGSRASALWSQCQAPPLLPPPRRRSPDGRSRLAGNCLQFTPFSPQRPTSPPSAPPKLPL